MNPQDNIIPLINSQANNDDKLPNEPILQDNSDNLTDFVHENNKKNIFSLIKNENSHMVRNIIDDEELFNSLSNEYKLIISELLSNDKVSGQEYIAKILDSTDHELTLAMVKNKVIYNFLNRNNKIIIIRKLLKSPWLPQEETKILIDILDKDDSNILNNVYLQNDSLKGSGGVGEGLKPYPSSEENIYKEHSSESSDYFPGQKKKRNNFDFLSEF